MALGRWVNSLVPEDAAVILTKYFQTNIKDRYLEYFLVNCPHVIATGHHWWWLINIGSGNGLVPLSNEPLPKPILPKFFNDKWRHYATMSWINRHWSWGWVSNLPLFHADFITYSNFARWRHQMETFTALLTICEGNSLVTGGFPSQKPVTPSFDVYFMCASTNDSVKPSRRRWFETPPCSLWRHCNDWLMTPISYHPDSCRCSIKEPHRLDFNGRKWPDSSRKSFWNPILSKRFFSAIEVVVRQCWLIIHQCFKPVHTFYRW